MFINVRLDTIEAYRCDRKDTRWSKDTRGGDCIVTSMDHKNTDRSKNIINMTDILRFTSFPRREAIDYETLV